MMGGKIWYKKLNAWEAGAILAVLLATAFAFHGQDEFVFDLCLVYLGAGLGIAFEILVSKTEKLK